MKLAEAYLPIPAPRLDQNQPLFTPERIIAYLNAGILEDNQASLEESFWFIGMTQDRRPLIRQRLKLGHLVAARVSAREIFEAAFLAGARAIVCVRVQYSDAVRPGLADGRLLWNLHEAARYLDLLLVDYLITQLDGCVYYSYQEHRHHRD